MKENQKRALKWALSALIICLIPLLARIWLERNGAIERPELGAVGDFVLRDEAGIPMTKDHLRRSITVILHWPSVCQNETSCAAARKTASEVRSWVDRELRPRWTEENNPLVLIIAGDGASGLTGFQGWRVFNRRPEEGTILPSGTDLTKPWLVVVDNSLIFAAREDLNNAVDFVMLERVLSKTAFDQYLGNYLARRTFMGPKRQQN